MDEWLKQSIQGLVHPGQTLCRCVLIKRIIVRVMKLNLITN